MPNFIKIGQTVAEIWRFNGCQNGGRPPSWNCEIRIFLMVGAVKRPILHQRNKFRKDRSNRCGYIAICVIFNISAAAIFNFQKFEILTAFSAVGGQYASSCQISSKSVKRLQTYGDLTVLKWRPSAILDL